MAVMAVMAVVAAALAGSVGWDTTASATVDLCRQSVGADGQTLYRAAVTTPGRTIPAAQASSMPAVEIPAGATHLPLGAIRLPDEVAYPQVPAGSHVRVHHRLFRSNTYVFVADDGTRVPLEVPPGRFDRVACTGS